MPGTNRKRSVRGLMTFIITAAVFVGCVLGLGVLRFYSAKLAYYLDSLNVSVKRYADQEVLLKQELSALTAPIKIYSYCRETLGMEKVMTAENTLWLDNEPTVEDVLREFEKVNWQIVKEVVFCGFGEPTIRLAELLELLREIKKNRPAIPTRLNTNGLGNLEHGRDITPEFKNILDVVSISLNAATADVANSGREVPRATTVRPIMASLTPKL